MKNKTAHEKQMSSFFYQLDNANGEVEILPILTEMNNYIDNINDEKEQSFAEESFKYYFAKRVSRLEDDVQRIKQYKNEYAL